MHVQLTRVTIAAKSKNAFNWINKPNFATAVLVANVQNKLLLEKGSPFPVPKELDIFEADELFSGDLFRELLILECEPVTRGVLSVHTQLVLIDESDNQWDTESHSVDEDCEITKIKQLVRQSAKLSSDLNPCFVSKFITPLAKIHSGLKAGQLLELVAAVDATSNVKPCERKVQILSSYMDFVNCLQQKSSSESCDLCNTVLVTTSYAKELSLFDGEYVYISVCEPHLNNSNLKARKEIFQLRIIEFQPVCVTNEERLIYALPSIAFTLNIPHQDSFSVNVQRYSNGVDSLPTESSSLCDNLPVAIELTIACVNSPTYNSQLTYSNLLKKHFTSARLVTRNGMVAIHTAADLEYWQNGYETNGMRRPILFFKVVDVQPRMKGVHTYLADCQHTTLILEAPVHSDAPTVLNTLLTSSRNSGIPTGLEDSHQMIIDLFTPSIAKVNTKKKKNICRSVLISGSPGCGKTNLVRSVADSLNMHFYTVNCHDLCCDTSSANEARIRNVLYRCRGFAPCVLCLRNIDALGKDQDGVGEDLRVAASFYSIINTIQTNDDKYPVHVVGVTSNVKVMCKDIQQAFLYNIHIEAPTEQFREKILQSSLTSVPLHFSLNVKHIAQRTAGFNLGDFQCLLANVNRKAHARISKYWFE